MNFIKGSSSLLFVIPTIKAFYSSKLLLWKWSNLLLIVASYLCNASEYNECFMFFDYFMIWLTSISYINHFYMNFFMYLCLINEYEHTRTIETSKNLALGTAVIKSIIKTYYYVDKPYYYAVVISSVSAVGIYKIRYDLHKNNNHTYNLALTYLMHICITSILYISSITAM